MVHFEVNINCHCELTIAAHTHRVRTYVLSHRTHTLQISPGHQSYRWLPLSRSKFSSPGSLTLFPSKSSGCGSLSLPLSNSVAMGHSFCPSESTAVMGHGCCCLVVDNYRNRLMEVISFIRISLF